MERSLDPWWKTLALRPREPEAWTQDRAPWADPGFSRHYARTGALGPGRARREARFLASLADGPGRAVDLGCGAGRTAIALADLGWQVLGLDVGEGALEIARSRAGKRRCRFERMDLRELSLEPGGADLVYSVDGTLAGFPPAQARRILRRAAQGLVRGGAAVLELPTPAMGEALDRRQDWYLAEESPAGAFRQVVLTEDFLVRDQDVYVHRIHCLDPRKQSAESYVQSYALYDPDQGSRLLKGTGLEPVEYLADFDGSSYSPGESHRLLLVARRKNRST